MENNLLNRIAYRNICRKKGRSICIVIAIFITAFLSMIAVSAYSYIESSVRRLLESERAWAGDAGIFVYSEDDISAISNDNGIDRIGCGYHLGAIFDDQGYVQTEIAYYDDLLAEWMNCYPNKGRMPQSVNEIVVSDDLLKKYGLKFTGNNKLKINYSIDNADVEGTFVVVGIYEKSRGIKDMILVSEQYYKTKSFEMIASGISKDNFPILVEMTFKNDGDIEANLKSMSDRIGLELVDGEYIVNSNIDNETLRNLRYIMIAVMFFIFLLGFFFISNVYSVSKNEEEKFYSNLILVGASRKSIRKIIYLQMAELFFPGVILGIATGYLFSRITLSKILSSLFSFYVASVEDVKLVILPFGITLFAVLVSRIEILKIVRSAETIDGKSKIKQYKKGRESKSSNLLFIQVVRRLRRSRKFMIITILTLFVSVLIGELVLTYINGFNVKKYLDSTLYYDFTFHSSKFSSSYNEEDRVFANNEIDDLKGLDGAILYGGGAVNPTNIKLSDEIWNKYKDSGMFANNEAKNMYTNVYGLDKNLLEQMSVLKGSIDAATFESGQYVIINSLGQEETGKSCWEIGDTIDIDSVDGSVKSYQVMAIAELPYELSYESKWEGSSDIFLPMMEWEKITGQSDYYIYAIDVEDDKKDSFENECIHLIEENANLEYESVKTIYEENKSHFDGLKTMAILILFFILVSTIINFFNVIFSEMIGNKKEVANMQSMGISISKIRKSYIIEGILFLLSGIIFAAITSPIICWVFIRKIINENYVECNYSPIITAAYVLCGLLAVGITIIFFNKYVITDKTLSERMRE